MSTFLYSHFHFFLAQSRIEALNEAFKSRAILCSYQATILLSVVAISLAASIVIFFWVKHHSEKIVDDSQRLFRELCRAHQLSWSQRRLLMMLARLKNLRDPSALLLHPELWHVEETLDATIRARMYTLKPLLFSPCKRVATK